MEVRQRVAIGVLGLGYLAARQWMPRARALHPRIASDAELRRWNGGLAQAISELAHAVDDVEALMVLVHEFRTHDQTPSRTSSFHMNRLMGQIHEALRATTRHTERTPTTERLRATMYIEQDILPIIRSHIESILHNHMLRSLA